jgi:uncharacterized membrane protein
MQPLLDQLNNFVNTLSAINPAWYIVLVGPLAYLVQRFLKEEENFVKAHGTLSAVIFAVVPAAFLAVMQTGTVQDFITHTALVGSPIYTIANLLFQHVEAEVNKANATPVAAVVTNTPAVVEAPKTGV